MQRRPPFTVFLILVVVLAWGLMSGLWSQIESARTAAPVAITLSFEAAADPARVRVLYVDAFGDDVAAARTGEGGRPGVETWTIDGAWVRDLKLSFPAAALAALERVEVRIGKAEFTFDRERLLATWSRLLPLVPSPGAGEGWITLKAPGEVRGGATRLAAGRALRNWPGDGAALGFALTIAVAITVAALLLYLVGRAMAPGRRLGAMAATAFAPKGNRAGAGAGAGAAAAPRHAPGLPWLVFGLAVMAAAALLLEARDPYYFTQDDNFAQFLPVILQGCAVLADGAFPDYNPYQYLGAPTASVGVYALSYPLTWLSCAIASGLLDDPEATIEVFALLHLAAGFAATFWAARSLGLRPSLAAAAALSFALSGFFLIGGRSWFYMLPVALWTPLLVVALERLRQGAAGAAWACLTGLAVGLFFHAGNAQMWSYALVFLALALCLLWWSGEIATREVLWAAGALLIGLAVAAPLLIPQWELAAGLARRGGGGGHGILGGLAAMVLPYPLVEASHPNAWGRPHPELMGHFYYAGTVIIGAGLAALLGLLAFALAWILPRRSLASALWLMVGGVALLLALGPYTPLWKIMSALPLFEKFKHPYKFLPYAVLFLSLGGAAFLEAQFRAGGWRPRYAAAIAVVTGALVLFHTINARPSFYSYGEDPYPPLPAAVVALLAGDGAGQGGRILPIAPSRSAAPGYVASLQHNFPTLFGIPSLTGYDPLLSDTRENRAVAERLLAKPGDAARAYGVRWLVAFDPEIVDIGAAYTFEFLSQDQRFLLSRLARLEMTRIARAHYRVYEIEDPDPLAFDKAAPATPLFVNLQANAVVVGLPERLSGQGVVLNFLARPGVRVRADGVALEVTADDWGRVVITPPQGARALELDYRPGWGRGLMAAAALALIALALMAWLSRRSGARAGP
ncbi:MAG: hypothetical protein V3T29_11015 [Alphaproteobacteria bacterium]